MTQQNQNNFLTKNFFAISCLQYNVYYLCSISEISETFHTG